MALQVWLPLTQDLRQQGLNSTSVEEVTSAVFDNNGKLGKCLSGGKIKIPASKVASIFNNTSMSIAFWYNNNTSETTGNHAICGFQGNTEGDTDAVRIWDFFNYSTPNTFHWSMGTLGGGSLADIFPANTWVHVCVTWNAPTLKIYMDGVLKYTGSGSSNYTFDKSYYISFGRTPQKLNDFRIYNNCLTPEEVKKIAQGLVLHYPLNHQGLGQENLASQYIMPGGNNPGTITTSGRTNYYGDYGISIPATENADTYFSIWYSEPLESGATYTLSAEVSGLLSGSYYNFPLFSQNNTSMGIIRFDHNGLNTLTFTMNYTDTIATVTYNGKTYYRMFMDDNGRAIASGQGIITIKNIKLEKGSIATPWCPNSSDMGSNATIEYDCSGFCNNGTRVGNTTWSTDTPKYQVSTEFNGTEMIEAPWNPSGTSSFTIAGWFYHNSGTTYYAAKNTYNTYICLEGGRFFIYPATGSAYVGYWTNTTNVWQHIVLVHDAIAAKLKLYVNGLFVDEVVTDGTVYNSDILDIGGRQGTAQYNGNISDFRIYATALSAEDIQALYQAKNIPD